MIKLGFGAHMVCRYRVPAGVLGNFVELLWLYDPYVVPHAQERLLPTATTELVFDLRESVRESSASVVVGPHSEYSVLNTSEPASVLGVHFKPGGAFPFFSLPAGELHNQDVSLDCLWGSRATEVRDRIVGAPSPEAKFDVLEQALIDAARTLARHRAVAFALQELSTPGRRSITEVTQAVGMSQRCFIDRFRDEVGMTPKLFSRVQRFQEVVKTVHPLRDVDWADIAASCGYFDQAHFIHDFRTFSGLTPSAYFALKSEHQNHVPLPD